MSSSYPRQIEIVDVSARDGLQNEQFPVGTVDKLSLIARAIEAGVRRIEVTSFVNPRAVPQMADAEAVCAGLPHDASVTYVGLVMNRRGADRAIATGRIGQLGAVAVATDRFAMANQGQTRDGSVAAARDTIALARAAGLTGQATIAASFGCPFEGEVAEATVLGMAEDIVAAGAVEIGLADTIGVASPAHVDRLVSAVCKAIAPVPVRVHFHNTRGTGLANVWAAIGAGALTVDGTIGGLGGCPFAPGAAGNVPVEDVVFMLERSGISTGCDLDRLVAANRWLGGVIDRRLPGMVARAPCFPQIPENIE